MGKDSPAPPAAPDYAAAAQAQGAANVDAARIAGKMNNPNIFTPYGSQTVTWGTGQPVFNEQAYNNAVAQWQRGTNLGDQYNDSSGLYEPNYSNVPTGPAPTREQFTTTSQSDQPTVTQTLNPQSQQIFDKQQAVKLGLADISGNALNTAKSVMNTPFSFGGPAVQTGVDTSGIARMPVNAGTSGQQAIMSRLEPSLANQRKQTETQLINQGLRPGGEAYDNAMRILGQQENDARQQAVLQGINLDMGANNQGFNQALQSGQFGNTAQQQALAQAIQQRQMPLNEISALMSGSQIQNPVFQPYAGSNVAPAPVMQGVQNQANAAMQLYGLNQGAANAQTQGLFGLGAAALGASGAPWWAK